jgi:3-hydroxyacyl-[acyl-carrier-protein] dehydratase
MNTISNGILTARLGAATWETDQAVHQDFSFPPDFVGFSGHFPGEPILPAVVQIGVGVVLVQTLLAKEIGPYRLKTVTRAKFLRKLKPGETITAQCTRRVRRGPDGGAFDIALTVDQQQAAAFTLTFSLASTSEPGDPTGG